MRQTFPSITFIDYNHADVPTWRSGGFPRWAAFFTSWFDRHLVASQYLAQWLKIHHREPIEAEKIGVVYVGVDSSLFVRNETFRQHWRSVWHVDPDEMVIIYVGRLDHEKDPMQLVHTANLLAVTRLKFRIVVIGDGPLRAQLMRSVRVSLVLRDHFIWLGSQIQFALPALYSAGDIFFLPSKWEGISLSMMEAMSASLAVVSIDRGGRKVRYVLLNLVSWLVRMNRPRMLKLFYGFYNIQTRLEPWACKPPNSFIRILNSMLASWAVALSMPCGSLRIPRSRYYPLVCPSKLIRIG